VSQEDLAVRFEQARRGTLRLLELVDEEAFAAQPDPEFSPIGWHFGHVAAFEEYWLLERCRGRPPCDEGYRRLFSPRDTAKPDRRNLPGREQVAAYAAAVRAEVLDYLAGALGSSPQVESVARTVLQHEYQHGELMAVVLQMQPRDRLPNARLVAGAPAPTPLVRVPAGEFRMGRNRCGDWYDNEAPAHDVWLDEYFIEERPVTNAQFAAFVEAGGYACARWWTKKGWDWREANRIAAPQYWQHDGRGWRNEGFFGDGTLLPDAPVCGVSWYEADAYARWAGRRLPTEAEWEKAAAWDPASGRCSPYAWGHVPPSPIRCNLGRYFGGPTAAGRFAAVRSAAGCADMNGNVWEWTATPFAPYDGFVAYPYPEYSVPYFDGRHMVLRGGSWASSATIVRNTFRNWYPPAARRIFAGFRCAAGESTGSARITAPFMPNPRRPC